MRKNAKTSNKKRLDEELEKALSELAEEVGTTKAELRRRAVKTFLSNGQDEAIAVCRIVMLQQTINELKDTIPEKEYGKMQECMAFIMKNKGGNSYGGI